MGSATEQVRGDGAALLGHPPTRSGIYEVTDSRDRAVEYLSHEEDVAHGLPTRAGTTIDEECAAAR